MNPALENLRDIHLPPPPGLWPIAPGWWLLIAVCLIGLAVITAFWWRGRRFRQLRQAARSELQHIETNWQNNPPRLLADLNNWLRRVNKQLYPASLHLSGDDWLAHLNASGQTDAFTGSQGRKLQQLAYAPDPLIDAADVDGDALLALCADWLKQQRRSAAR